MSVQTLLDIGLALLVVGVAAWTIAAREAVRRGGRLCRIRAVAGAGLDPAVRARCRADGGGGRQRRHRRAARHGRQTARRARDRRRSAQARTRVQSLPRQSARSLVAGALACGRADPAGPAPTSRAASRERRPRSRRGPRQSDHRRAHVLSLLRHDARKGRADSRRRRRLVGRRRPGLGRGARAVRSRKAPYDALVFLAKIARAGRRC